MSAREHDESKVTMDVEAAYLRKLSGRMTDPRHANLTDCGHCGGAGYLGHYDDRKPDVVCPVCLNCDRERTPPKRYRTIVADPPWDHSAGTGRSYGAADPRGKSGDGPVRYTTVPYSTLTVSEIAALPVAELAESAAHLYLWTTQKFLQESFGVVEDWGFKVNATLIWCKKPMGFFGGPFYGNSTEFCHFSTRGSLAPKAKVAGRWFQWPRGAPSERTGRKPDAFLDLVEQVSPGPYVELFARRARFGWDYWGDQSLGTAALDSSEEAA